MAQELSFQLESPRTDYHRSSPAPAAQKTVITDYYSVSHCNILYSSKWAPQLWDANHVGRSLSKGGTYLKMSMAPLRFQTQKASQTLVERGSCRTLKTDTATQHAQHACSLGGALLVQLYGTSMWRHHTDLHTTRWYKISLATPA